MNKSGLRHNFQLKVLVLDYNFQSTNLFCF